VFWRRSIATTVTTFCLLQQVLLVSFFVAPLHFISLVGEIAGFFDFVCNFFIHVFILFTKSEGINSKFGRIIAALQNPALKHSGLLSTQNSFTIKFLIFIILARNTFSK